MGNMAKRRKGRMKMMEEKEVRWVEKEEEEE
jgi:hypothetical protein